MPHTGEEWFRFSWPEYAVLAVFVGVYLLLVFRNKLPGMRAFKDFADTINTAGGHIILLGLFSLYFFKAAMQFFYHVMGLPDDKVTKANAIIMTGIAFLTGTAFGGAWAALLKTMTGGKANGPAPPVEAPGPASNGPQPVFAPSTPAAPDGSPPARFSGLSKVGG
jgi:hypothetical protein